MRTEKFDSVKSETSIDKCLKYSENPEGLKSLLSEIDVLIKFTGIKKHFVDDKKERLTGIFKIVRNSRSIEFEFGFSINDTEIFLPLPQNAKYRGKFYDGVGGAGSQKFKDKKVFMNDLLYSCLSCVSSEYYCPIDFDEFCNEFGYDNDSIKAKTIWEASLKQSNKLQKIFNDEEIQSLPR